jgi:signal transduction histidine kinase
MNMRIHDLLHPSDADAHFMTRRLMEAGEMVTDTADERYVRRDGTMIFADRTLTLERSDGGEPLHFRYTIRDITEERGLAIRGRDALAEVQAKGLALEETYRSLNEFLALATHELRSPLTTLVGANQLAAQRLRRVVAELDGRGEHDLSTAVQRIGELLELSERSMTLLSRLISDLVDVSRVQSGRLEIRAEVVDLVAIVHDAVHTQQVTVPGRVIRMEGPDAEPIEVVGDADRIEQVVINYLSNALKYSAKDSAVKVRMERAGNHVRVSVTDAGPGIPLEAQEHIWERFYRVQGVQAVSGSGVGLGLGLYVSRSIIEAHGGSVGVESVTGQGSTFWFSLPLIQKAV